MYNLYRKLSLLNAFTLDVLTIYVSKSLQFVINFNIYIYIEREREREGEQYWIGTWNIRSMNQRKLEVVKQEMARVNTDILRIS